MLFFLLGMQFNMVRSVVNHIKLTDTFEIVIISLKAKIKKSKESTKIQK